MLKKIFFVIILLLFVNTVCAAEIEIYLNQYDSEAGFARIQIENNAGKELGNINLAIDSNPPKQIAGGIPQGLSIIISERILPGTHVLKVTTKEGISAEKTLNFAMTLEQIKREREEGQRTAVSASQALMDENYQRLKEEQLEKVNRLQEEQIVSEEVEETTEKPKLDNKIIIITIVIVLIIFGVIYFLLKGKKPNVEQAE